jgi:hypothetical protein
VITDITQETRTLAQQARAAEALVGLTRMYGHLPAPTIRIHATDTATDLTLEAPTEFEMWRTALQVAPDAVALHAYATSVWLVAEAVFRGVRVYLYGYGVPLTVEQARTVQEPVAVSV